MVGCLCFLTHGSSSGSERIVIYPLHNSVAVGTHCLKRVYEPLITTKYTNRSMKRITGIDAISTAAAETSTVNS